MLRKQAPAPIQLGRYQIVDTLGRGAMGVVYKGFDPVISRSVALKTIRKDLLDPDHAAGAVERFKHEAMASGRLNHPGIIAIHEYGEHEDTAYIVMEYAPGNSLGGYMERRTEIDLHWIADVMAQLLEALDYAHGMGIIHRDVKPTNVIVGPSGRIKVTDFGIARINTSTLTQTGMIMGTPSYMAPEQYVGLAIDQRADVFSAGVMLYELITGVKPFEGAAHTVAYKICHEPHRPPSLVNASLPAGLDEVVGRALAKKPENRYASANLFAQALHAIIEGHDLRELEHTTIILPRAAGAAHAAEASSLSLTGWQPGALGTIETALLPYVGPLARTLVKRYAGQSFSMPEFQEKLAQSIDDPSDRKQFLESSRPLFNALTHAPAANSKAVSGSGAAASTPHQANAVALTDALLEQAITDLTPFVGPIAKVLVKKATPHVRDLVSLYKRLAENLGSDEEKKQFIALAAKRSNGQ